MPGGHIEHHESLVESVIREVKEETGLTIKNPRLVGIKHFYTSADDERYLVFLYKATDFSGELSSSAEGQVEWVAREKLADLDLAYDMKELLRVFDDESISEFFYRPEVAEDFKREYW